MTLPLFGRVGQHTITCDDVLATLRGMPDNTFDALLTDPPYGFRFMGKRWDYDVPNVEVWREALRVLKPGAPLLSFGGTRTYHRIAIGIEDAGFELRDCLMWLYGSGFPKSLNVGNGYGTALKPAWEPCILARKPLDGTVAENVAKWGVGGLAIDACRIATDWSDRPESWKRSGHSAKPDAEKIAAPPGIGITCHSEGRWPANLALDEDAAAMLDAQTGTLKSGARKGSSSAHEGRIFGLHGGPSVSSEGGASRFFYCAKVSTREREFGCEALPKRTAGEMTDSNEDDARLESPRTGAGRGGGARNHHPTLKPIALTTWLARLILPPTRGASLLVPYSGAGSEMIGALMAGWSQVFGIEGDKEYVEIAHARVAAWERKAA